MKELFTAVALFLGFGGEQPQRLNEVSTQVISQEDTVSSTELSNNKDKGVSDIIFKKWKKYSRENGKHIDEMIYGKNYEQDLFYEGEDLKKLVQEVKENQEIE